MKKGFTIIELLSAIVILGIISVIAIPSILSVRKRILENTYQDKINLINRGALEWASDNINLLQKEVTVEVNNDPLQNNVYNEIDCTNISVNKLIEEGYIVGDNDSKTILSNPLEEKNFNEYFVCVRFDTNDILTRKIISHVIENVGE